MDTGQQMFLPRAKKEMGQPQVGPGFYPPGMHDVSLSDDRDQWGVDAFQSLTRSAEATAKIKSIGRSKKYNLMAQLTCRDKNVKSEKHSTTMSMERNMHTDDELVRLQERLLESERLTERIVSGNNRASGSGRRRKSKSTPTKKEEKLLRQLRQITQLMQEGRVEGASPEMEAEEVPYSVDWEGYPEETYPEYDVPNDKGKFKRLPPEEPINQPTAEALAERMDQEEEEVLARKLSVVEEEDEEVEDEEDGDEDVESEEDHKNVEDDDEDTEEENEEEDTEEEDGQEDREEEDEGIEEEEEQEEAEAEKRLLLAPAGSKDATNTKPERLGLQVYNELQAQREGGKHITFNDRRDVFHYPIENSYREEVEEEDDKEEDVDDDDGTEVEEVEEEADEDDPVTEAERLQFNSSECPNPEEEADWEEEEYLSMLAYAGSDSELHIDVPKEVSGLRMRNRRET